MPSAESGDDGVPAGGEIARGISVEQQGHYLDNECSAAHLARLCFDTELSFSNDWHDGVPADLSFKVSRLGE